MRFFIDTEFSERGPDHPITLISLGLVAEDGRELYCVSNDFLPSDCNEWVRANVLPKLAGPCPLDNSHIREEVLRFVGNEKPEFWGYYADYDWVVFAQLFGSMVDLPKGWPMYCNDLKQWAVQLGDPKLPSQGKGEHNALQDARWNKKAHAFLQRRQHALGGKL